MASLQMPSPLKYISWAVNLPGKNQCLISSSSLSRPYSSVFPILPIPIGGNSTLPISQASHCRGVTLSLFSPTIYVQFPMHESHGLNFQNMASGPALLTITNAILLILGTKLPCLDYCSSFLTSPFALKSCPPV